MDILKQVASRWKTDREALVQSSEQIVSAVTQQILTPQAGELSQATLDKAYKLLRQTFDSKYGGFGGAPKFPAPHNLAFLLRYHQQSGDSLALEMVETTLNRMADGGIYDHIGFGFSRYSTDRRWLVPHFEKMLYDNALLAWVLVETYQLTGNPRYARVAGEIFTYVLRDMTSSAGAFFSAEDADSEGEEGKYYVWTPQQVIEVLGPELGALYNTCFNIAPEGNFAGKNIPNLIGNKLQSVADNYNISLSELRARLMDARKKLWLAREKRVHPHKDDKILTAWNGLMIAALAKAAQVLDTAYAEPAERAARFILDKLVDSRGRLLARYRDGEAAYPAYVDDYAFLIWGLLELYEATFNVFYLAQARRLNDDLLNLFWDAAQGGLFMYGKDSEQLLARPKEVYDGATPSGNSVAALNFLRLARLTGEPELAEYAERTFAAFAGNINAYPAGYTYMLQALWFALNPGQEIVISGDPYDPETQAMLEAVRKRYLPAAVVLYHSPELAELVPSLAEQKPINGQATAYVCRNFACQAPVTSAAALQQLLDSTL